MEDFDAETLAKFAHNEALFDSITSSRAVYDLAIVFEPEGLQVNPISERKSLKMFVSEEADLVFTSGVFAAEGGLSSGANSGFIVEDEGAIVKELVDAVDNREEASQALDALNEIRNIVKSLPDYVLVSFGVENDLSYMGIHKDDYEALHKFIPLDEDADYWLWDTEGGKKVQFWDD